MNVSQEDQRWVRPYALTNGRTRPSRDLPIESLVTAVESSDTEIDVDETSRSILDIATTPISVAEIAARCGFVLGVARVLVADLMESDLVRVSLGIEAVPTADASKEESQSHIAVLERVLNGLQSL